MPDKQYKLKACPNCKSYEYGYGHSVSESLTNSLTGIDEIKLSKFIGWGLFQEIFDAYRRFMRVVIMGAEEQPLLICKHCKNYVAICPKCNTYSILENRPKSSDYIKCNKCKYAFCTCERSYQFDKLLGKNPFWSWWTNAMFGVIIGFIFCGLLLLVVNEIILPLLP